MASVVPSTPPPNNGKGGEGDVIGLMATTLPMAAVSRRRGIVGEDEVHIG